MYKIKHIFREQVEIEKGKRVFYYDSMHLTREGAIASLTMHYLEIAKFKYGGLVDDIDNEFICSRIKADVIDAVSNTIIKPWKARRRSE